MDNIDVLRSVMRQGGGKGSLFELVLRVLEILLDKPEEDRKRIARLTATLVGGPNATANLRSLYKLLQVKE